MEKHEPKLPTWDQIYSGRTWDEGGLYGQGRTWDEGPPAEKDDDEDEGSEPCDP